MNKRVVQTGENQIIGEKRLSSATLPICHVTWCGRVVKLQSDIFYVQL